MEPRYIAKKLMGKWFVFNTECDSYVCCLCNELEAQRYANGYNLGLTDRQIVEEYSKVLHDEL